MDVFRFKKLPMRANDPTRRYRILTGEEGESVGNIEIGGNAPEGDTVLLTVDCFAVLSDAAREDALHTSRRFLDELIAGWGFRAAEIPAGRGWEDQPDGGFRMQLRFRLA